MFEWLFRNRDYFTRENNSMAEKIYHQVLQLNKDNKYKARIIMEFILNSFKSNESIQNLYDKVNLTQETNKMDTVLKLESLLKGKKYLHYKQNIYTAKGVSIPVKIIKDYDKYITVKHTEDDVNIKIYQLNELYFHDYKDDVFMIYSNGDETFAQPYERFFSLVDVDGEILPRFKEIEQ